MPPVVSSSPWIRLLPDVEAVAVRAQGSRPRGGRRARHPAGLLAPAARRPPCARPAFPRRFPGPAMRIGVPFEIAPGETRVALVPETVGRLVKAGFEVVVESHAGERAGHDDGAYLKAGATIAPGARELYAAAAGVLKVREPVAHPGLGAHEAGLFPEGS